jgi:hypothetical protein
LDWSVAVERDEIATLTPLGGYDDPDAFRQEIDKILRMDVEGLIELADATERTLVVDAHTTIEVTVTAKKHACMPRA